MLKKKHLSQVFKREIGEIENSEDEDHGEPDNAIPPEELERRQKQDVRVNKLQHVNSFFQQTSNKTIGLKLWWKKTRFLKHLVDGGGFQRWMTPCLLTWRVARRCPFLHPKTMKTLMVFFDGRAYLNPFLPLKVGLKNHQVSSMKGFWGRTGQVTPRDVEAGSKLEAGRSRCLGSRIH